MRPPFLLNIAGLAEFSLASGLRLLFALYRGFFIMLSLANFLNNTVFGGLPFETAQSIIKSKLYCRVDLLISVAKHFFLFLEHLASLLRSLNLGEKHVTEDEYDCYTCQAHQVILDA